jgi:hypothetical protein
VAQRGGAGNNGAMVSRLMHREVILQQVEDQGVGRPFRILLRMPEANRQALGRLLGCRIDRGDLPEAQAWRLINQNLRGLQARTHRLHETLTPFSRNNNWWEIVTRTARGLGLRFYPGLKDEEVERLLFDHLAAEFVRHHERAGDDPDRFLAELHPNLGRAIASLGLSRTGQRALVATLLRAAASDPRAGRDAGRSRLEDNGLELGDPREGHNRIADWLRKAMPWTWATSISTGLRLLQHRLGEVHEAWTRTILRSRRTGNYTKVATALAVIYLHDVIERTAEQFDLIGG